MSQIRRPAPDEVRLDSAGPSGLYESPLDRLIPRLLHVSLVVATLAVVLGAAATLWYAPASVIALDVTGVAAADRTDAARIRYEPGATFDYRITLRNRGPFGITVVGVSPRSGAGLEAVSMTRNGSPAGPFALRGGESADILVQARFGSCPRPSVAGSTVWRSEALRFRVLGVSRKERVPLPRPIEIDVPPTFTC